MLTRFQRILERVSVADNVSLNQHLDKAIKHYSSLFKLPSYKSILMLLFMFCLSSGILSTLVFISPLIGVAYGLFIGLALFFVTLLLDYFLALFVLKGDPIYDLRRTAAFSLFCWALWLFFIIIGYVSAFLTTLPIWEIRLCLLGFSAVLIFRLITLYATSSLNYQRYLLVSLLHPFLSLIPLMFLWWLNNVNFLAALGFSVYALAIAFASSLSFILVLNFIGGRFVGEKSIPIFRAFLLNWVADLNSPFESFLEKLSEERDVEVAIMRFDGQNSKVFIVVPLVHPGPFKNVGSSLLPYMLKTALERKFGGVACVPLGLLGHELDVASQSQVQRIISTTLESAEFKAEESDATPFVKVSDGLATACCQIFGKTALIAFSLAPKTTEDFPKELSEVVCREAEKLGLESCIAINAHNSMNGFMDVKIVLKALEHVAVECIKKAISTSSASFKVGAATVMPKEFSLRDGMGPGGITVLAVEVESQKTAYVVIDGNNMVSGLREKILDKLKSLGFVEGEVFTTDTHAVNAVTFNERGYHPVGEAIDHEKLMGYIVEAARKALSSMEPAKFGCRKVLIPRVKVIGQKPLEQLCVLTDKVIQTAKRIVVPLFGVTFLVLMLALLHI
jgi:putative membrane protein